MSKPQHKMICILVIFLLLKPAFSRPINADDKSIKFYEKIYSNIVKDDILTQRQKQRRVKMLRQKILNYERELRKTEQAEIENNRRLQTERENLIYRQYLTNGSNRSSILNDFLTMRY